MNQYSLAARSRKGLAAGAGFIVDDGFHNVPGIQAEFERLQAEVDLDANARVRKCQDLLHRLRAVGDFDGSAEVQALNSGLLRYRLVQSRRMQFD